MCCKRSSLQCGLDVWKQTDLGKPPQLYGVQIVACPRPILREAICESRATRCESHATRMTTMIVPLLQSTSETNPLWHTIIDSEGKPTPHTAGAHNTGMGSCRCFTSTLPQTSVCCPHLHITERNDMYHFPTASQQQHIIRQRRMLHNVGSAPLNMQPFETLSCLSRCHPPDAPMPM